MIQPMGLYVIINLFVSRAAWPRVVLKLWYGGFR